MPNFGILNPIQSQAKPLLGEAPPAPSVGGGDDGGIGDLLKGAGSLAQALKGETPQIQAPDPVVAQAAAREIPVTAPDQNYAENRNASLFDLAKQHLGQNETKDAPVLMSFFNKTLGQNVDPVTTPWCAAYANAVLKSGGVEGTGSLAARSFLKWGQETKQPTPGDIVVLSRGSDPTKGHVGFYAGTNPDGSIQVLGGNQGNSVSMKAFSPSQVLGYRRPPTANDIKRSVMPESNNPGLPSVMAGIAYVESKDAKDPYTLISKSSPNGDRAYGKYQIMGNNIPSWTKEAIGRKMTPEEFLRDSAAQERTAAFHLNKSLQAGYSPEDVASIWFSGRPQKKAGNSRDAYGTSVPQYINRFQEGVKKFSSPQMKQSSAGPLNQMMANSSNPNLPPNIPAFNQRKPLRDLSPEEIRALMRWNAPRGLLG